MNQTQAGLTVFDRAWWTASFVLIVLHAADIPFFDSRLNIVGWILLAGLRSIIISLNPKKDSLGELVVDAG